MKRFIYAYHVTYQDDTGVTNHIDGVADMENEIRTMDDYRYLKKSIEPTHWKKSIIRSLTLIAN